MLLFASPFFFLFRNYCIQIQRMGKYNSIMSQQQRIKLLFLTVVLLSIIINLRILSKYRNDSRLNDDKNAPSILATSGNSLDTTIESNHPVKKTKFYSTPQPMMAPIVAGSRESTITGVPSQPFAPTTGADKPYSDDPPDDEPESNEDVPANPPTSNKDVPTNPPTSKPKQTPTRAPTFVYTLPPGSNRTNLSISLPSSEWLEDIDTYTQVLGCGGTKCAFHSITGKHGYLVTLKNERELQQAKSAVDMAEYFAATYGIRHTVLARPITTDKIMKRNITMQEILHHKVLVSRLETRLERMKQNVVRRRKGRHKDRKLHHGEIFIMPIELYSTENILFKCTDEQSRAAFTMAGNLQPNKDIDPVVFAETLQSDLNRTIQMMESPEAACLSKDFQLVIDTTTGGIIHIDIDRCFHGKRTLFWDKPCQKTLHSLTKVIIDRVTYGDHHPNTAKKSAGQEGVTAIRKKY